MENKKYEFGIDTDEMMEVGVHFGHLVSKLNPKMKSYISGARNNCSIIDLEKTAEKLQEALKFIEKLISEGKTLLLVGTKIQLKELIAEIGVGCGILYINERWLGGTFTNFKTISKRVEYFKELEKKKAAGELEKYTKKERMGIDKEIEKLKRSFEGIKTMDKLPDAVFVADMKKDILVANEARKKGIKIVGITDTNTNPALADYPIPGSDDSTSSVKYILNKLLEVVKEAKQKSAEKKQETK